jgi:hypothetical protein
MDALIIGIAGNIIVMILTWLTPKIFIPIYNGWKRNIDDISGEWNGYDVLTDGTEKEVSEMTIKQYGTRLSATVTRKTNNSKRLFEYEGKIIGKQIVFTWKETTNKNTLSNIGTAFFILKTSGDRKILKLYGKVIFYHNDSEGVILKEKIYKN